MGYFSNMARHLRQANPPQQREEPLEQMEPPTPTNEPDIMQAAKPDAIGEGPTPPPPTTYYPPLKPPGIDDMEGDVYKCSECGAEISYEAKFCHKCGSEFDTEPNTSGFKCASCGKRLEGDGEFCYYCGGPAKPVETADMKYDATPTQAQPNSQYALEVDADFVSNAKDIHIVQASFTPPGTKYCSNCGRLISQAARFCEYCGNSPGSPTYRADIPASKPTREILGGIMTIIPLCSALIAVFWIGNMTIFESPSSKLAGLAVVTVIATAILATVEAYQLGIGGPDDVNEKGVKRSGPIVWFFFITLVWIIGFPAYLYQRSRYGMRNLVAGGIVVAIIFIVVIILMETAIKSIT